MRTLLGTIEPIASTRGDMVDQASSVSGLDERVYLASIRSETNLAARIIRERKEAGTYGFCDDCGEPIAKARLEAKPHAVRCTRCQDKHEAENPASRKFGFTVTRRRAH